MNQKKIEDLVSESHQTTDPKELHKIADKLQGLGAWDEAAQVRRKATKEAAKLAEVN